MDSNTLTINAIQFFLTWIPIFWKSNTKMIQGIKKSFVLLFVLPIKKTLQIFDLQGL